MSVQFIVEDDRRRFAVLPIDEYEELVEARRMLEDIQAWDAAKARNEDHIPIELVDRMLAGESPVRVFREHRGISQQGLAEAAAISAAYLCQIEQGRRQPSVEVLKKLAAALRVDVDDIA
ncbi:helix-turn-helix domain-containing protein [Marinimicrococcus flavescens]|uniref:Helix-turn-helix transcriptional regulator n=1 Tax=Marinimicrococcus flavescens TaxID=3031815 RepID=A0AAP4D6M9_9PROT|nr:helix-turn-helix transcriptional regulator [Marinimicrococcus flavescens]